MKTANYRNVYILTLLWAQKGGVDSGMLTWVNLGLEEELKEIWSVSLHLILPFFAATKYYFVILYIVKKKRM